ncbi:hypothetical protein E2562_005580 [Oryza meyeriana var. granulata]|uniref:Uncharacterized protein n=1 Tax=Oryza meyeriana var. granulata TaxID=110450 RepID=A0A6G1F3X8_9ORYZ|nr:hypothetical protein E2562_005580 [Oryza meyeriana var. granulata]
MAFRAQRDTSMPRGTAGDSRVAHCEVFALSQGLRSGIEVGRLMLPRGYSAPEHPQSPSNCHKQT